MELLYWQYHWSTFQSWKGDRNTITNYDRNEKLRNIQRRELISSICKTLRALSVHRNVSQYSPVLQRFSAKTIELSLALNLSYSWHKANWVTPASALSIFPRIDLPINKDQRSFFGNFPFVKKWLFSCFVSLFFLIFPCLHQLIWSGCGGN